jgi:hypothetical protein
MLSAPLPFPLRDLAPGVARRFALILAGLCAVVASRLLHQPRLVALIIPLWTRLNRASRRFERLMAHLARHGAIRHAAQRRGDSSVRGFSLENPRKRCRPFLSTLEKPRERTFRLPHGKGWLIHALGHEAAAYAAQLSHLLAEPGTAELLAAAPAAGRILRPLCRMLGIPDTALRAVARRGAKCSGEESDRHALACRKRGCPDTALRAVARQATGVFPLKNPESVLAPSPPPLTLRPPPCPHTASGIAPSPPPLTLRPPPCPHLRFRWPWYTRADAKPA